MRCTLSAAENALTIVAMACALSYITARARRIASIEPMHLAKLLSSVRRMQSAVCGGLGPMGFRDRR
jgi:hypothetical protein